MRTEDVLAIVKRMIQNKAVTEEQIDAAVEKYHKLHPLETDKTLSISDGLADAKAVGDELEKKVSGKGITLFYDSEKQCAAMKIEG